MTGYGFLMKTICKFSFMVCLLVAGFSLTGCDMTRNALKPDRSGNMEIQDYRDMMAPRLPDVEEGDATADSGSIPGLQPYIAHASEGTKAMPLVSISVNQSVPLRDILFELAQQADYDLELDPRIKGSIIFTARERPFDQVIQRISDIAGLRYRFDDDVLRVELDTPYNKTYKVDYLSYVRTNKGNIRNDVAVVSGDGADTGSGYEASSESLIDFWGELEVNLLQILGGSASGAMKTKKDPRITATEQNPDVQAVAPMGADGTVQVQPPNAVLQVNSLPVDEEDDSGMGYPQNQNSDEPAQTFTINKQAGLLNVFATEKTHKEVEDYLRIVRRATTAQVLIEAKILEVGLRDEFATGIDWRLMNNFPGNFVLNYISPDGAAFLDGAGEASQATLNRLDGTNIGGGLVVGHAGDDVQALVKAISGFGSVKALASPRLTVLNNQSAVLNVATNKVYFELDVDTSVDEGTTTVDVSSDIRNVPEGVLVNVQPSINLDNRTISMAVRPTITRIVSEVDDPAVAFVVASLPDDAQGGLIESKIPELNVQEIDSIIQVPSGETVIMGGLLQDRSEGSENGVPGLSEVPMVGALFRQHVDRISKTELVILLKATIIESPSDTIHNTDRDIYRAFSGDRRPSRF
jgi:general secretion pathway protein D